MIIILKNRKFDLFIVGLMFGIRKRLFHQVFRFAMKIKR